MTTPNWLTRYIPAESRLPINNLLEWDGYGFVTDARSILAVRGVAGEPIDSIKSPSMRKSLADLVDSPEPGGAAHTTLSDLWAWLDRVERETCPTCGGLGRFSYTIDGQYVPPVPDGQAFNCYDCGGRGWDFPDATDEDIVRVADVKLDRNRLAWWLAAELGEPTDTVTYWARTFGKGPLAVFAGETWKLLIGGFRPDDAFDTVLNPYRTYTPGAGLWYESRRQFHPSVHPGTDWFREQGFDPDDLVKMWGELPKEPKCKKRRAKA